VADYRVVCISAPGGAGKSILAADHALNGQYKLFFKIDASTNETFLAGLGSFYARIYGQGFFDVLQKCKEDKIERLLTGLNS